MLLNSNKYTCRKISGLYFGGANVDKQSVSEHQTDAFNTLYAVYQCFTFTH